MRSFIGEFIGTFILVFFGCWSVAISIIYDSFSLFEIAFIWCLAVTFGIFASRNLSNAHLNPAVSISMFIAKKLDLKSLPSYLSGQFTGAFFASAVLYLMFNSGLEKVELVNNISRNSEEAITTAKMFGEFYSEPLLNAFLAEAIGTFFLVFLIFQLTHKNNEHKFLTPFYIGFVVAAIICIVAPITQAGLNPARDLAPRLFSYIVGWNKAAFSAPKIGWFWVYVVAPLIGGIIATFMNSFLEKTKT